MISLISLLAAYITYPEVSEFFGMIALGLAMNVGYQLDSIHGPWAINFSLALGVILGYLTESHTPKHATSRDIILLIFTLPNLFMAQYSK